MSLCPGTACAAGIIDAYAGAVGTLGSGLQNQGPEEVESRMAIIAGTSSCHILLRKDPIYCPGIWGPYEGAILEGFSCLEGGQTLTGKAIDLLLPLHPHYSEILNLSKSLSIFEVLNELVGNREEEFLLKGKNLHINPDIHGNRAPLADPSIRGMISGWSMDSSLESLLIYYVAILASLAYSTKNIIDSITKIDHLIISGGMASNSLWLQMLSDVCQCSVETPKTEAVLLGSAMLAASAFYSRNLWHSMTNMSLAGQIFTPTTQLSGFHKRKFSVFLRMYLDQQIYKSMMA